ncbi:MULTISPECIES: hypothetical protein [Candidatus Ichthyocystis]|uniref:Putative coiled coil protein n=1 Tax=Candidatus Ichthyocystis hellenicum TaxID=1561003 RepID=A0A0S4M3K1_9BURK|nr:MULTISPECIES: hypothetical protein [Ichthyocystis]CUT17867.1 putative coiled coil protein [Candidatus Ichthyocystis hellenicum]
MYQYCSSYNITEGTTYKNENTKIDIDDNTAEKISYIGKNATNNYDPCVEVMPKYKSSSGFLNIHTNSKLYQEGNCEEKLLIPDIFKLTKSDEYKASNTIDSFDTNKQPTSPDVKSPFIEYELSSIVENPQKIALKQITDDEKTHNASSLTHAKKTANNSTSGNYGTLEGSVIEKEICIKLSRCNPKQIIDSEKNKNAASLTLTEQTVDLSISEDIEQTIQHQENNCDLLRQQKNKKELHVKLYRCNIKQRINNEKDCNVPSITSTEQLVNTDIYKSKNIKQTEQKHSNTHKTPEPSVIKKKLSLRSYRRSSLCCKEFNSSIYRNAIKKIDIDDDGSFKNSVLEEMGSYIKNKTSIEEAYIDLSSTYLNVRRYTLEKISPLLNKDITATNISITPGMSISDLKSACIANHHFFKNLQESCEKIVENIKKATDDSLLRIFQWNINFYSNDSLNSTNKKIKFRFFPNKNKLISKLRELIIDTISNLPNRIICEINKFNQDDIVNGLFSDMHGVLLPKSLIRNLSLFFNSNKKKIINNKGSDYLSLFNDFLEKIVNLVRPSCIFNKGVFLPDDSTVEHLSKYLLSDMYDISSKFRKKLELHTTNILKTQGSSNDISPHNNYEKDVVNTSMEEEMQMPKLDLAEKTNTIPSDAIGTKTKMVKKFNLGRYRRVSLCSAEFISNIYEDAIRKIDIDNDGQFMNIVSESLSDYIMSRGLTKSSINLSLTYSNVKKYILDKVSPYISDIITAADVLITPGMSISEMSHNCVSNNIFFEKLREECGKIVKNIQIISDDYFLNLIQNYVWFGTAERLRITNRKNKFCSGIKSLIMETISNLPNNIIHEIKKFKKIEIVRGLFSCIHGILLSKTLIRNINSNFYFNKIPNGKVHNNLSFLKNLLQKLIIQAKNASILHEEKSFSPDEPTTELISKYLLSDMYGVPIVIWKKIDPSKLINRSTLRKNYTKDYLPDNHTNIESQLIKKNILIPKTNYKWNSCIINPINIYEIAISMIDIDKKDFENCFIEEVKHFPSMKDYFTKKRKKDIDLSITYTRVKNYILEIFYQFLKEIEKETKIKISLYHGMSIDELEYAYISNEKFFNRLNKFCTKVIRNIEKCSIGTFTDIMQCFVHLETEIPKTIVMRKKRRMSFHDNIAKLLISNISNLPKTIVNIIKLMPKSKFVESYFYYFYDIYIENSFLLEAKSMFDIAKKKVVNDNLLRKLKDSISSDMIVKFGDIDRKNMIKHPYPIVNKHKVHGKLSTYSYVRKLAKKEFSTIKENLKYPIMIMHNHKIETANQEIKNEILNRIESDLVRATVSTYTKSCIKAYKSKLENKNI